MTRKKNVNKKKHKSTTPTSRKPLRIEFSSGVILTELPDELVLEANRIAGWSRVDPRDGSGDEVALLDYRGTAICNLTRGSDKRSITVGVEDAPGTEHDLDDLVAALRTVSRLADQSEAQARAEGWWSACHPSTKRGSA